MKLTEVDKKPTAIVFKAGVTDKSIEDYIEDKKFELTALKGDIDEDVLAQVIKDRKLKLTFYKAPVIEAFKKIRLGMEKDVIAKAQIYGMPLKVYKVSSPRYYFNLKYHVFYSSELLTFGVNMRYANRPSRHTEKELDAKASELSQRYYYKGQMRELNRMRVERTTEADFEQAVKRANVLDLTRFLVR